MMLYNSVSNYTFLMQDYNIQISEKLIFLFQSCKIKIEDLYV